MNTTRIALVGSLMLALPLIQGCCCCCRGCGGGPDLGNDWGDELSEALAEEAVEQLGGIELDIDEEAGTVTVGDGEGTLSFAGGDAATYPADLPLPQYPGSQVEGGVGFTGGGDQMSAVVLRTDDSLETVSAWYAGQLGPDTQRMQMSDGSGQQVHSFVKQLDGGRQLMVGITAEDGQTAISLSAVSEGSAQ